jgi:RNA polymerase primary sigma factor
MIQLVISKGITQRAYKSLDKFFNEIDKIELTSSQKEVRSARRMGEGEIAAPEHLNKTNLRLFVSVAKQYQKQELALGDLNNEGIIGIITAAKHDDETKGFKFAYYAVWWIRQSITMAIAVHARKIRLPNNQLTLLSKLFKTPAKLEQKHARKSSDREQAELPTEKLVEMIDKSGVSISIGEPFQSDDDYTLLDILPNDEASSNWFVEQEAIAREIHQSKKVLNKRDHEILVVFLSLERISPMSFEKIAMRFNLSKKHIGRLKEKALNKLRNCSNAPVLMSCRS